jgi:drug/metabolite transporter (DMT)-like permease
MLKAFVPVVTMVVAFAFGVERPSLKLVLAVVTITAGVAGTSYGAEQPGQLCRSLARLLSLSRSREVLRHAALPQPLAGRASPH